MTGAEIKTRVQTRGLSINAAFLKDIKDDSRDLKLLFDQIEPLANHAQTAVNHWPELISLFANLRDQLALHFSLEEAYGYFDDALDAAPQLSVNAECLRGQHSNLYQRISELAERALEIPSDRIELVTNFIDQLNEFSRAFAMHEEAELKLILQAMDDDIGVGD
jgi:hypothetical protein